MLINYKNKGKKGKRRTYGITELKAILDNIFTTPRNYTNLHFLRPKESDSIHEMGGFIEDPRAVTQLRKWETRMRSQRWVG